MTPDIPNDLLQLAAEWDDLHRWERKQLGLALRRLGLTYSEIQTIIPVPKGTLSNWSRGIVLSREQRTAITSRAGPGSRRGIPVNTQRQRHDEIRSIQSDAAQFAQSHLEDSKFIAGVVLYWGEGAKTRNYLDLSNGDPAAIRAFVIWVKAYLDPTARFVLSLHLHEGNDERAAKTYWRSHSGLPGVQFTKTYIKPRGTGHRKNHLPHGICRVRTRNASDHWNRVMVWIDVVQRFLVSVDEANR
jgi:hypothetical protein